EADVLPLNYARSAAPHLGVLGLAGQAGGVCMIAVPLDAPILGIGGKRHCPIPNTALFRSAQAFTAGKWSIHFSQ
ncbi:MAG: hypothetical protein Q7J32_16700, partial [Sphingomonadaceae bacterium]|nr:hypothetical protein [Sphingomonadaceae bacterium]